MPRQASFNQYNPGRRIPPVRALGIALIALGLIATTSCTQPPEPEPVSNPVKLLQSVRVGLSPAAGVQKIEGTTISVSAEGDSSAENTTYDTAQVVGELPVRVSLQYRAGEKSGSDLAELKGHTGPVEINLTLENLTVKPQTIQYDAAGQARSDTALVGAPLTIAASTKLPGIRADDVTPGSADGTTGTNGVLSSTEDGATVVQWATVLAPPRSGASTTLRLAADVKDFQVPEFDVAVQPGLNTDLSANGVLASAFSSGTGSEMELQRRTISLVSDVNTVLAKAGSTITDVRRNLQATSQTLGAKTAGELRDNSKALAATMSDLKQQLQVLGSDLESSTTATQSTTMSQLKLTVSAVDAMLGDTSATPPVTPITGDGCTAEVAKAAPAATVYSSVLTMSSQLDAYAKVSAGCRDTVAGALKATMGPENPTPAECAEQGSMTCSLYGSAVTVTGALLGLVQEGDELVSGLQPQVVEGAIKDQATSAVALEKVRTDLGAMLDGSGTSEDYSKALAALDTAIKSAEDSATATRKAATAAQNSVDTLRQKLLAIAANAKAAKGELGQGTWLNGSMLQQNQKLADELCKLSDDGLIPGKGKLSAKDVDRLRSYLTSVPCEPTDEDGNPSPALNPPPGFKEPLDVRLEAQSAAWDEVLAATDTTAADQAIGQAFTALEATFDASDTKLEAIKTAVKTLDGAATGNVNGTKKGLESLDTTLADAIESSGTVTKALAKLKEQQDMLGDKIKESLRDVSAETAAEVYKTVDEQVRQVADIGDASSEAVTTAFNRSISGLKSTSDDVVKDAEGTVNKQRDELLGQSGDLTSALSKSTQASLDNIAASTSGSTRDVEGASALLASSLNKVMLDLGDRAVNGSGLLGSMATSAAKADTADFQLALASQNAEGYANIRSRDVAGLLLRQAQFKASLTAVDELPPFQLEVPAGATSQTLYTLKIGGAA
ncbi:putative transcriptional regulator [Arthrobacter bambusae]|uniref:Transcriptional regulator n=1 Tax=Arthrobacter bambusae TaxID=1338426 RepID=A0ABV2P6E7_9MICC